MSTKQSAKLVERAAKLLLCLSVAAPSVVPSWATSIKHPAQPASQARSTVKPDSSPDVPGPESKPTAPEPWRKNAPSITAPRAFNLPSITRYKLDNGLDVELYEDHRFPFITTALGIKAGSAFDPQDKLGIADVTADMLVEGTDKRTSKQIATDIDFLGGSLKAVTDYDFSIVSASALSKYTDQLFDIFSDILFHPTFPQNELDLRKTNVIQELAMKRSDPNFLAEERFCRVLFGNHPYSIVAPTPASISSLTRSDLQQFHDRFYLPNQSVLIAVGDFDTAKMKELIASKFGAWKAAALPVAQLPEMPQQKGRRIYLVNRPGSVQSSLHLGNVSIKRQDPDYFPILVANQILGGAAQARLFLNIREQKGYTYGAYSGMSARRQPGAFEAEAEVRTDVTSPSIQEFLYELDRIRNVPVTEKELKDAKSYLTGSFQLGLETQSGLAQRLLDRALYELPTNYLETYADKIATVKAEDVRKAARRLIDTNNLVITVVGDGEKIAKELEYFAPVDVYDTNGKLTSEWNKSNSPGG